MSNNNNILLPVYALVGSDKLKAKYVLAKLEKRLSQIGNLDFNKSVFDGQVASGAEIAQTCLQLPFDSEKRYVLVKDADKLNKKDIEDIINYLSNPNKSTVMALLCTKLAKTTRLFKACEKISATTIIDCSPPKKYKIADSLIATAKSHNGSINLDAAQKLVELIGEDTMQLDSEIQKLLLANNNTAITLKQVEELVNKSSEVKPWDFTNAFAERDIKKCYNLYKEMPDGVQYQLLPQICRIVKELICVKDLGVHATQNEISNELGYEAWRVKNHIQWSRNFTKNELISILANALICDKKMKSATNSALTFETFILESLNN